MPFSLPPLSRTQLATLAFKCGVGKSGTKQLLESRLINHLRAFQPLGPEVRVLSIDLGIRNFAFSLFSPPASADSSALPVLHAWNRLSLARGQQRSPEDEDAEDANDAEDGESDVPHGTDVDGGMAMKSTAPFSPAALSAVAVRLVQEKLLPLRPTHVLVERQRFRSGGGSAVLEWTARVNSLEAMLYAVFSTLKSMGQWDGCLVPVEAKRVSPFLVEGVSNQNAALLRDLSEQEQRAPSNKKQKIDLVGTWLTNGTGVAITGIEPKNMANLFLDRWAGKRRSKNGARNGLASREPPLQRLAKLDDLADSLLQGVAWIKWQENTAQARYGDLQALIS